MMSSTDEHLASVTMDNSPSTPPALPKGSVWGVLFTTLLFLPLGLLSMWDLCTAKRLRKTDGTRSVELVNRSKQRVVTAAGIGLTAWVIAGILLLFISNDRAVAKAFLDIDAIRKSFPQVLEGFWLNISLFLVAEVFILVFGLILAVMRSIPGRSALVLRWVTTAYIDIFRGLPSLLVILIVVYGLKRTQLPLVSNLSDFWYVVIALTLHYSAYTAEVIKSGADGIHWSQTAAARSLGLSHAQTMRYVILPQAFRRMTVPLLNYFIGLQKDTALVGTIGLLDAVNRATVQSINLASLSTYTGVALCFLVITIPLTRFADVLDNRRRRRESAGS